MGFAPFAEIISGFETALAVNNPTPGNSNGVDQAPIYEFGTPWVLENYPDVSVCTEARLA
jgi:hypothetical protein